MNTCLNTRPREYFKEFRKTRESGAVVTDAKLLSNLAQHGLGVTNRTFFRIEAVQEVKELGGMEGLELGAGGPTRTVHVHVLIEAVL